MKVSKKVREKIKKDNRFSLLLALKTDRTQSTVKQLAQRNSSKLTEATYVEFYKEQGFKEDEIFEKEVKK
ncbi:hypothetical protein CAPN010_16370 [Capnocytophaga cynodegmi]|uniref:hypothetical protein n=1 Tax=Capnocytophaga cynodegmi TaxID=28189 RepID=UPI001EE1B37A|nr:hypothetical protein [Capnocytophaga cynodegmi]GJQ07479.1 hypothetical protein CAPN010_16370 [Capnocytophaga cynodegmi]